MMCIFIPFDFLLIPAAIIHFIDKVLPGQSRRFPQSLQFRSCHTFIRTIKYLGVFRYFTGSEYHRVVVWAVVLHLLNTYLT